jgi:hypothetical protein
VPRAPICHTERMLADFNGWHLVILVLFWIVPFVITVVSVARDRMASATAKAVWVLIALLFPLLALILWFTIGRKPAPER